MSTRRQDGGVQMVSARQVAGGVKKKWEQFNKYLVRLHRALIGILTVVVFWGVEMDRGMSQSPGRKVDEDAGG
jgi:hypothetical protein